jgi:putative ABC transport system permease protein
MLRASLTLALRTLRRRLGYTAVNTIGLTVGLACCALAAVFLQYELSWDAHHENADRIYRILSDRTSGKTLSTILFENSSSASAAEQRSLAEQLRTTVPAVEQATNYTILSDPLFVETPDGDRYASDRQLVTNTGPAFADLFTFERLAGAPLHEALAEPRSVVLTTSTAETYFGDTNPIGKTLTVGSAPTTVRAVVADPPSNSRITFDLALQLETIPNWGAFHYVRLAEGTNPEIVEPTITEVMNEVNPIRAKLDTKEHIRLQPLTDVYLADRALYDAGPHRNAAYLWIFAAIGLLVLGVTTINYTNLALALYTDRDAEIGVRKAMGGHRGQIARQFLVEASVLALLCVPLALLVCSGVLPAFNALMDTNITAGRLWHPSVLGALTGLALLVGLVAGGYPAFVLGRSNAVDLFDRTRSSSRGAGRGGSIRHGLIALQFVVLIGLGSLSWIAYDQLRFMQSGDLGYETANVVRTNFSGDSTAYQQFRERLTASPAIQAVGSAGAAGVPQSPDNRTAFGLTTSDRVHEGGTIRRVDVHWFEVMGVEHPVVDSMMQAGPSAPTRHLINETAAALLQTDRLVGTKWQFDPPEGDNVYTIDGVMSDLYLNPMRQAVAPAIYTVYPQAPYGANVLVRLTSGHTQAGMEHLREVWSEVKPDTPLTASFLSEEVATLYQQERRFTALSGALAVLAVVMAALGLASLVAYLTRLRRREIGIRKALGGSVASIVALLNKEYVQIVGAAFALGAPLAWIGADWWLGRFAYQVDLSVLPFLAAGLGALAVAIGAVSVQAFRAAQVDPAQVLRSE